MNEYFSKCKVIAFHDSHGPFCVSSFGDTPYQNDQDKDTVIHIASTLTSLDVSRNTKSLLKFKQNESLDHTEYDYYYFNFHIQSNIPEKEFPSHRPFRGEVGSFMFYFNNKQKALYPSIRQEITKYLVHEYNMLIEPINDTVRKAKGKYNDISPKDRTNLAYYKNLAKRLLKRVNDICNLSLETGYISHASKIAMGNLVQKYQGILLITLLDADYHLESYYSLNRLGEMDDFNNVNSYIADSITGEVKQLFISLQLLKGWSGKKLQKFIEVRLENQKLPPITEYYVKLRVDPQDPNSHFLHHLISSIWIEGKLYYISVKASHHITRDQLEKAVSVFPEYVNKELTVLVN